MYDMDLRDYDPAIGRWVNQDPVVHFDYSPYNAFDNNPVFYSDPGGADSETSGRNSQRNRNLDINGNLPGNIIAGNGGDSGGGDGGTDPIPFIQLNEVVVTYSGSQYQSSGSWSTEQYYGDWYDYSMTTSQYDAKYGEGASANYTNADYQNFLNWQNQMDHHSLELDAAAWFNNFNLFVQASKEALYFTTANGLSSKVTSLINSSTAKGFNYIPRYPKVEAVHGNSLNSTRETWGYKLYSSDGTFLKNGITSQARAESRYTKSFMSDKYMEKQLFPNRRSAYDWEFMQNTISKGPLNKNMH